MGKITLVLGGARSGKSRYAEHLAQVHEGPRIYIATAEAFDEEMKERIILHQKRREGLFFKTIEEPLDLAMAVQKASHESQVILIDCVTVWLGNLLHHIGIQNSYEQIPAWFQSLKASKADCIIVSNEVGEGIVPADPLSRHFRDQSGWLNQDLAALADAVVFVVAGIPLYIKGEK